MPARARTGSFMTQELRDPSERCSGKSPMESVQAEAAAWVARLDGQVPAADERARFHDWIARSPDHARAYEDALRTWRDLAAMRGNEQYHALLGTPTWRERIVSILRAPRWVAVAVGSAAVC